jgi:hypothetical protein
VKRELLVGCGNRWGKRLWLLNSDDTNQWGDLTTLDNNYFDGIHAYDVLEHCWQQGDYKSFFALFSEFWRILKPGGMFYGIVPLSTSEWIWGDPGHSCVITLNSICFLSQKIYDQVGVSGVTDYRSIYKADFDLVCNGKIEPNDLWFILRVIKGKE